MNRSQRKSTQKEIEAANKKRPSRMMPVPKEEWPEHADGKIKEVWLSNKFLAQIFEEDHGVLRVSVCRTTLNDNCNGWSDNITWDELMEIKRQICHSDSYAVEVLPPDADIVNVANMRHFWIMPEAIIGWGRRSYAE